MRKRLLRQGQKELRVRIRFVKEMFHFEHETQVRIELLQVDVIGLGRDVRGEIGQAVTLVQGWRERERERVRGRDKKQLLARFLNDSTFAVSPFIVSLLTFHNFRFRLSKVFKIA